MLPSKKIRVLECIRQGQIGGGETHLLTLVQNIDMAKFEPVVLSFTDGPMISKLNEANIKTHVIYTEKPFDIRTWKKVRALLIKEKITLVHCHGTRAMSNVFKAARSLKIPIIYTIHGWSFHDDQHPFVRRIKIWSEHFLTLMSQTNISVSESNMASGKNLIPSFKAVVINNGIDQEKFNPLKQYKNIRDEIKVDDSKILIVFIARFTIQKQPLSLIKAFAQAFGEHPSSHLLMVGDGDQREEAYEMAQQMSIRNSVSFLPFREDVPDLLAAADVFVLPSLWEGLPIGLIEAMSMSKAVIATNVDGSKEIVKDGYNGLLIDTDDLVQNLAKAIVALSGNKTLRERLSKNAVETVKANYNAALMTRKTENVYLDLINERVLKDNNVLGLKVSKIA